MLRHMWMIRFQKQTIVVNFSCSFSVAIRMMNKWMKVLPSMDVIGKLKNGGIVGFLIVALVNAAYGIC